MRQRVVPAPCRVADNEGRGGRTEQHARKCVRALEQAGHDQKADENAEIDVEDGGYDPAEMETKPTPRFCR